MFLARQARSDRHSSARSAAARRAHRLSTLERRYDFHLGESIMAALQGSHDKAAGHSGTALLISRELSAGAPDPEQHQPEVAAALCAHARYGGGTMQAIAMLAESAGLYAALAEANPSTYEVARIDVLTRIALASDAVGATGDAISLLREVAGLYRVAPAADPDERDFALAGARFQLGRCLLTTGAHEDGLAETDAGLELAAKVLGRLPLRTTEQNWLVTAPRYVQQAAPGWAAAAVRSMTLHADCARWPQAATSAAAATTISAALAALGGEPLRDAHQAIMANAQSILAQAARPEPGCTGSAWTEPVKPGHDCVGT